MRFRRGRAAVPHKAFPQGQSDSLLVQITLSAQCTSSITVARRRFPNRDRGELPRRHSAIQICEWTEKPEGKTEAAYRKDLPCQAYSENILNIRLRTLVPKACILHEAP